MGAACQQEELSAQWRQRGLGSVGREGLGGQVPGEQSGRRWKGRGPGPWEEGQERGWPGTGSWAGEAAGGKLRGRELGADIEVLCLWGWGVRCE